VTQLAFILPFVNHLPEDDQCSSKRLGRVSYNYEPIVLLLFCSCWSKYHELIYKWNKFIFNFFLIQISFLLSVINTISLSSEPIFRKCRDLNHKIYTRKTSNPHPQSFDILVLLLTGNYTSVLGFVNSLVDIPLVLYACCRNLSFRNTANA